MKPTAKQVLERIQDALAADGERGAHWLNEAHAEAWVKDNRFLAEELDKLHAEVGAEGDDEPTRLLRSLVADIEGMRDSAPDRFGPFSDAEFSYEIGNYVGWPNLSILSREAAQYLANLDAN